MGTLYLVATPIGNLEDISARALRVLRSAQLIAAEDTRHTRKLLAHYDIHTPLTSYQEHNRFVKIPYLLAKLQANDVALVSDAGTPGLNDPGYELVKAAINAGYTVTPIPGPSAPISALVASGLPTDSFLYLGYLPRKSSQRQRTLSAVVDHPYTLIFLESPHRLLSALKDMLDTLGDRQLAVARELTKVHEEIFRGTISAALGYFSEQPTRGEFTLVVSGNPGKTERWSEERLRSAINKTLAQGISSASKTASQIASEAGWQKRAVYRMILDAQKEQQSEGRMEIDES